MGQGKAYTVLQALSQLVRETVGKMAYYSTGKAVLNTAGQASDERINSTKVYFLSD